MKNGDKVKILRSQKMSYQHLIGKIGSVERFVQPNQDVAVGIDKVWNPDSELGYWWFKQHELEVISIEDTDETKFKVGDRVRPVRNLSTTPALLTTDIGIVVDHDTWGAVPIVYIEVENKSSRDRKSGLFRIQEESLQKIEEEITMAKSFQFKVGDYVRVATRDYEADGLPFGCIVKITDVDANDALQPYAAAGHWWFEKALQKIEEDNSVNITPTKSFQLNDRVTIHPGMYYPELLPLDGRKARVKKVASTDDMYGLRVDGGPGKLVWLPAKCLVMRDAHPGKSLALVQNAFKKLTLAPYGILGVYPQPEKRTVVVKWLDGSTTTSKAHPDDTFSVEQGLMVCLAKKYTNGYTGIQRILSVLEL